MVTDIITVHFVLSAWAVEATITEEPVIHAAAALAPQVARLALRVRCNRLRRAVRLEPRRTKRFFEARDLLGHTSPLLSTQLPSVYTRVTVFLVLSQQAVIQSVALVPFSDAVAVVALEVTRGTHHQVLGAHHLINTGGAVYSSVTNILFWQTSEHHLDFTQYSTSTSAALPLVLAAVALRFAVAPHVGREAEALRAEERVSHTRVAVQLVLIIQAISHAVAAECPVDAQATVAREVTRRTIPCAVGLVIAIRTVQNLVTHVMLMDTNVILFTVETPRGTGYTILLVLSSNTVLYCIARKISANTQAIVALELLAAAAFITVRLV